MSLQPQLKLYRYFHFFAFSYASNHEIQPEINKAFQISKYLFPEYGMKDDSNTIWESILLK